MSSRILFVFEGEKTEAQIVQSMQECFLPEEATVKCVYGAEIYQIYNAIKSDEDLDTFNLIKERSVNNASLLDSYQRDDFAEIYLFFDYDGHSSIAHDDKLNELLNFFNEETRKGKLYISYPMVESLKHICDYDFLTFKDLKVLCKVNIKYKNEVATRAIKDLLIKFTKYDSGIWVKLIAIHLKKMNFIVNGSFTLPSQLVSQSSIFSAQLSKYINPDNYVAVLSSFPIFLHDYYGNEEMIRRIS